LLTAVFARQATAVVGVRTCWPWKLLRCRLLGGGRRFGAHGGGEGRGYTAAAARLQLVINELIKVTLLRKTVAGH